jgi:hypothetical protein
MQSILYVTVNYIYIRQNSVTVDRGLTSYRVTIRATVQPSKSNLLHFLYRCMITSKLLGEIPHGPLDSRLDVRQIPSVCSRESNLDL